MQRRRPRLAIGGGLALVLAAIPAITPLAASATGAGATTRAGSNPCPTGMSLSKGSCTATFSYTGKLQKFKVPAGVTSLVVVAGGGMGGSTSPQGGQGPDGGFGGQEKATVSVAPGQTLDVVVGGQGGDSTYPNLPDKRGAGGYGGGGEGSFYGGGGGGGSFLYGPGNKLLVAAGGGGGNAGFTFGGSGGTGGGTAGGKAGGNGASPITLPEKPLAGGGGGATTSKAGAGGVGAKSALCGSDGTAGTPGTGRTTSPTAFATGGTGADPTPNACTGSEFGGGGGGGGGYFAGGGGGSGYNGGGGGGGGSGYAELSATNATSSTNTTSQDGAVTLTLPTCETQAAIGAGAFAAAFTCKLTAHFWVETARPVSGLSLDSGVVGFLSTDRMPEFGTVDGVTVQFAERCLSGCTNIAVRFTYPDGRPAADADITATLAGLRFASPVEIEPSSADPGYICYLGGAIGSSSCGTTVKTTTDADGVALFRYWVPGAVNPDLNLFDGHPNPKETLTFEATKQLSCVGSCLFASGSGHQVFDVQPWLWVKKSADISTQEIDGLRDVLSHNAINKKNAVSEVKNILKVLEGAKVLTKNVVAGLKGISDIALSSQVDELMRTDPDLVLLDWLMNKFSIASPGLLYQNLDPGAWGHELGKNLIPILSGKITGKLKLLKKYEDNIKNLITTTWNKLIPDVFQVEAIALTQKIIDESLLPPRTTGKATLRLFDVSHCRGQCLILPLPIAHEDLFLVFNEDIQGGKGTWSFESKGPLGFTAQTWVRAQCGPGFGCYAKVW